MGQLEDVVGSFEQGSDNTPKEYAKEVRVSPKDKEGAIVRFLEGKDAFIPYDISWIMCDSDEKMRPFIIKNSIEGESILSKMFGDRQRYFQGGYFHSTKNSSGGKQYTYQAKDPELLKLMTEYWNPAYNNKGTSVPKEEYIFNVIHRNPETIEGETFVWCEKEKHTKVTRLNKSGVSAIFQVFTNDGPIQDYDIKYTKTDTGAFPTALMLKAGSKIEHMITGPVTDAEKEYTSYVLADIVKLSSAFYILKHITPKIKRMDAAMGTNFYAELEKQAAMEAKLWEEKKGGVETKVPESIIPAEVPSSTKPLFDDSRVPSAAPQYEVEKCSVCGNMMPKGSAVCPICKTEYN